jgi:hypothetical protein
MVDFFSGGRIMWLVLLLDHFFLGLQKDGTIPCPMIWISLVIHAIQRYLLASTPALPSICVAATRVVVISFRVESPIPAFWLRRFEIFLLVFWWSTSI